MTFVKVTSYDMIRWLDEQRLFSIKAFGPGELTPAIVDHIRKELREIEEATDRQEKLDEFIDVVIMSLDACWRLGFSNADIIGQLHLKQLKNKQRKWPNWRTADRTKAMEHVREEIK
jgi:hypothetical protein